MPEYRSGRRRRRSRSGRRGSDHRNEQSYKTPSKSKPKGFLGWLKKLFGLSGSKAQASENGGSRRGIEQGRNGSGTGQRSQRQPSRSSRRDAAVETAEDTPEASSATAAPSRRKAELLEVTTPRLYVGNLGYEITESDLFDLFSQAAPVKNVEIARDRENERSKGFGFVEFSSVEDARVAQAKLNGYELAGRPLLVSGAKAPASRRTVSSAAATVRAAADKTEGSELMSPTSAESASAEKDSETKR
jgi:hypothetical protein